MILAYQCQITQIKDDLKENKRNEENWSNKLAVELKREHEKYDVQILTIETNYKKNLQMVSICQNLHLWTFKMQTIPISRQLSCIIKLYFSKGTWNTRAKIQRPNCQISEWHKRYRNEIERKDKQISIWFVNVTRTVENHTRWKNQHREEKKLWIGRLEKSYQRATWTIRLVTIAYFLIFSWDDLQFFTDGDFNNVFLIPIISKTMNSNVWLLKIIKKKQLLNLL
jgi:hypothetical protein